MAETLTFENTVEATTIDNLSAEEQDSLEVGEAMQEAQDSRLAGKYENAQELEKAYIELEKKLGEKSKPDTEKAEPESAESRRYGPEIDRCRRRRCRDVTAGIRCVRPSLVGAAWLLSVVSVSQNRNRGFPENRWDEITAPPLDLQRTARAPRSWHDLPGDCSETEIRASLPVRRQR